MELTNHSLQKLRALLQGHPRLVAVLFLFALGSFAFAPWVFCGRVAPWDFQGVSATGPVFSAASIASGNWPTWTTFVAGGIPLSSFLGAELFFPLWWVAGLFDLTLTLSMLAKIQVLFVVGGSLGYVALLRAQNIAWRWALVAGTAFIFFGGNFAEASHSGAVRGFALVPWVLWSLTAPRRGESWQRLLWMPLWVWFLSTGIYPAFLPTMGLISGLYLSCELLRDRDLVNRRLLAILLTSGVSSALIMYGAWSGYLAHDSAGLLYRPNPPTFQIRSGTSLQSFDIFGLFLDPWALRSDGTIHSWGVGIPILLGLAGVTYPLFKKHLSIALAGLAALFLAIIPQYPPVGRLMVDHLSFLFPTRFVAMDVKSIAALAIIVFSTLGWREIIEKKRDRRTTVRFVALLLLWLLWLAWGFVDRDPTASIRMLLLILAASLFLVEVAIRRPALSSTFLVIALLGLITAEGVRTTAVMYHNNGTHAWHGEISPDDPRNFSVATLDELLNNPPERRPERTPPSVDPQKRAHGTPRDGIGLVGLGYNVSNYGGYMTAAYWEMVNDPDSLERFLLPWTPWIIPCLQPACADMTSLPPAETWVTGNQILTTEYNQESIDYLVNLDTPVILVENEINFPGWVANDPRVTVFENPGPFRSWRLEPGKYSFTAYFSAPDMHSQVTIFMLGLLLWVLSAFWWLRSEPPPWVQKMHILKMETG
jgi:hypothetical protein